MQDDKRKDYITKQEAFMGIAKLIAKRSKDPNSQVGAVIVSNDDRILSLGYNGFPNGCSDDELPWVREYESEDEKEKVLNTKYPYVVHAELNAILNFRGPSLEGSTIYVTMFPCNECAKALIQSGIKKVIYLENKYPDSASTAATTRLFELAEIELCKYEDYSYLARMVKLCMSILKDGSSILTEKDPEKAYSILEDKINHEYIDMILVP